MSPRVVIPLSLALAAVAFAVVRALQPPPAVFNKAAQSAFRGNAPLLEANPTARDSGTEGNLLRSGTPEEHTGPSLADQIPQASASEASQRILERWIGRAGLAHAKPDELEAIITGASTSLFTQKDRDYQFAVRRLAELDPERAANLWAGSAYFRMQSDLFLGDWAKKDPAAFGTWMLSQTPDTQRASASILGNQAQVDPDKFAQLANSLASSPAGPIAVRSAIQGMRDQTNNDHEKVLAYANNLPAGPIRDAALVETLKGQQSGAAPSPEALAALGRIEPEDARRVGRELAKVAEVLPEGAARESAYASSLREQADKDPAGAAKRLESLSGTPDYAAAVRGFVEQTARKDPGAAAEWALTIPASSPLQRISALERVASAWFKAAPDDARAWVEKAALTDTEYFQLTGRNRTR